MKVSFSFIILLLSSKLIASNVNFTIKNQRGYLQDNVVISLMPLKKGVVEKLRKKVKASQKEMVQKFTEFHPKILPINIGDTVIFPNKDTVNHSVYSFSKTKSFNIDLYKDKLPEVTFDQAGVVTLGCNIHDWMVGYVYISQSPLHAVSKNQGKLSIKDIPLDTYKIIAWHPKMKDNYEYPKKIRLKKDKTYKMELVIPVGR